MRDEPPAGGPTDNPTTAMPPGGRAGDAIGPFRLLEVIGQGGFGVVWLAEQTEPVRRRVALKVIKPGMDSRAVVMRFEAERQAMALMDHPSIASVFDGGTTREGRPYFVMEFIKGEPITAHCDRQKLTIDERIDLFVHVCEGVQHAHQKGVIHRDIKPSNVLVKYVDGKATPVIIDFGVAKALNQRLTEETLFTAQGQFVGTPEYMSPEQAEMSAQDIDTRTDVYSLGVVLYELLAGGTPFDSQTLRAAGYEEIRRIIREVDPPKPSTKLSSMQTAESPDDASSAEDVARARRADPSTLGRKIRGELDWVVMRCLEKDRERRYKTAEALAEELGRYLRHEPVDAGPPGAVYRLSKFVRRNRPAVAIVSIIAVAVGVLAVTSTVNWRREAVLRERAELADAESRELLDRLSDIVLDAEGGDGESIGGLRDEAELVRRFAGDPIGEANARVRLAFEANRRGQVGLVLHHAERAIERFDEQSIHDTEPYLDALTLAGIASRRVGRFESAEAYAGAALTLGIELYGPKTEQTLALRNNLAVVLRHAGRWGDAQGILEEVLEGRTELLGADDRRTLRTRRSIVECIRNAGEYDRAIELGKGLHADSARLLGADDRDTLASASNLGLALAEGGRAGEACELLGATLDLAESSLGPDDVRVAVVRENYAGALRAAGRHADAEEQLDRAISARFALSRVDDPIVLEMLVDRADSLVELGRGGSALGVITVAEALGKRLSARDDLGPIRLREVEQQAARAAELRSTIEN